MSVYQNILDEIPLEALLVRLNFDLDKIAISPELLVFGLEDLHCCKRARRELLLFLEAQFPGGEASDYHVQFAPFEKMAVLIFYSYHPTQMGDALLKVVESCNNGLALHFAVEGSGPDLDLGYVSAMDTLSGLSIDNLPADLAAEYSKLQADDDGFDPAEVKLVIPEVYVRPEKAFSRPHVVRHASVLSLVVGVLMMILFFTTLIFALKLFFYIFILSLVFWIVMDLWALISRR